MLRDTGGRDGRARAPPRSSDAPLVADAVRALLGLRRSAIRCSVRSTRTSSMRATSSRSPSRTRLRPAAAQLANAFADTLVNERTATFQSEVAAAVRRYTQQVGGMTKAEQREPGRHGADATTGRAAGPAGRAGSDAEESGPGDRAEPGPRPGRPRRHRPRRRSRGAARPARRRPVARGEAGGGGTGPVYDAGVSDRAAERLADRLEQRLVAREAALAPRASATSSARSTTCAPPRPLHRTPRRTSARPPKSSRRERRLCPSVL